MTEKEKSKKNQIDMLHGPLLKKILLFALPLAATSILQQLFNTADTAVAGKFAGHEALAAVGSTSSLIGLYLNLFIGVSIGANVVIANFIGQKKQDKIHNAVRSSMSIAILGGFLMIFVGIFTARPALILMGAPDDVLDLAVLYMRIYFIGMPFAMIYNFGSSILRSKGDTKRPLYCLMISGVFNVGLNLLLVIVFHLSVAGVAIATVTSNFLNCCMILYFLAHEEEQFRFRLKDFGFKKEYVTRILQIGIPSGVQGMVFSVSNVCIQSAINSFGSTVIAGSAAAVNFEFLAFFVVNAFVQTAVTFTSQNFGARNYKRCTQVYLRCLALGLGCAFVADYGFWFFKAVLISLFTSNAQVVPYAYARLKHVLLFQPMVNGYEITGGAIRGTGRSLVPALVSLVGTCFLRIVWATMVMKQGLSYETLLNTYPASWAITTCIMLAMYFVFRKKDYR